MSNELVKRWIRSGVLSTSAYHVQGSGGLIKLDAMENPYSWPADIRRSWLRFLEDADINRYPSADAPGLKSSLRRVFSIPDNLELLLGNGSDEIIQIIMMAMAGRDTVFMAPEPSFVMYGTLAASLQCRFESVPLAPDFMLDRTAMLQAIGRHEPAAVFIAYPNNPTGNLFDENALLDIVRHAPGLVVIDEAYHAFAGRSFLDRIGEFENLLVMRTMSKLGLAGLRLGFLAGPPCWLREFDKLRLPYNINVLTQASTEFILEHVEVLNGQAAMIRRDRDQLFRELSSLHPVKVWHSSANFLLFRVASGTGDGVFRRLKQAGVLVKNLNGSHPLLADCLRVTVGTSQENSAFISALTRSLDDLP